MKREDKLKLSAEAGYGHAFKQGLFAKRYEQSRWRFVHQVKTLKPMLERVKGGPSVIYGGLPLKSFEALVSDGQLPGAEQNDYGWRWPVFDHPEVATDFESWRAAVYHDADASPGRLPAGRDILAELTAFNLATHSPMETMSAVLDWQDYLRQGSM